MKIEVAQLRTTPELHYFWMEAVQKCCSGHMLIHLPMQPESSYIALKCSFIQQNKWICYITSFGLYGTKWRDMQTNVFKGYNVWLDRTFSKNIL